MSGFIYHQNSLHCDGVPLTAIAEEVGTPTYVYSAGLIRARYTELADAFAAYPAALHYALKANSNLAIVRLLRSLGASADANSIGEIDLALRAGFIPPQIVFTGVGKTRDELERAVGLGLKAINAESAGELDRIDSLAQAQGVRARVALRVNPNVDAQSHPHISTGLTRNKFGVPIGEVRDILRAYRDRAGLHIAGIHLHIGSQITSLEPLRTAYAALATLAEELVADGIPLEHLDLGGGLGFSYDGSPVPDAAAWASVLVDAARRTGLSLIVEPGRSVIAPAGAIVSRVVDVKASAIGRQFVILDAGMTELMRPALYGAFHRIVPVQTTTDAPEAVCDVVGPVCESSDTFGVERRLPLPAVDDLMAILDTGAYGMVMASNYNRRPMPAEVLVDDGAWRVIRRRQTIEDMLASEV